MEHPHALPPYLLKAGFSQNKNQSPTANKNVYDDSQQTGVRYTLNKPAFAELVDTFQRRLQMPLKPPLLLSSHRLSLLILFSPHNFLSHLNFIALPFWPQYHLQHLCPFPFVSYICGSCRFVALFVTVQKPQKVYPTLKTCSDPLGESFYLEPHEIVPSTLLKCSVKETD